MNLDDYESENTDSDDEDFNPLGAEDSGEESIDEKYEGKEYADRDDDEEQVGKSKKRKKTKSRNRATDLQQQKEDEEVAKAPLNSEAEKKRIDDMFADFLASTEMPPEKPPTTTASSSAITKKPTDIPAAVQQPTVPKASRARSPPKIFEFAGETIAISSSQSEQSSVNSVAPASTKSSNPPAAAAAKRPAGSGLSSVLNQLGKKTKLSVLEKTKLDWDGFKSKEGISEELKTHNRGRDGFLERRDFLERTDLRQFEIEKNMRSTTRRSNK